MKNHELAHHGGFYYSSQEPSARLQQRVSYDGIADPTLRSFLEEYDEKRLPFFPSGIQLSNVGRKSLLLETLGYSPKDEEWLARKIKKGKIIFIEKRSKGKTEVEYFDQGGIIAFAGFGRGVKTTADRLGISSIREVDLLAVAYDTKKMLGTHPLAEKFTVKIERDLPEESTIHRGWDEQQKRIIDDALRRVVNRGDLLVGCTSGTLVEYNGKLTNSVDGLDRFRGAKIQAIFDAVRLLAVGITKEDVRQLSQDLIDVPQFKMKSMLAVVQRYMLSHKRSEGNTMGTTIIVLLLDMFKGERYGESQERLENLLNKEVQWYQLLNNT